MAYVPESGSVLAKQGTTPWSVLGSVAGAVQIAGASPASIATVSRMDGEMCASSLGIHTNTVIHGETTAAGGGTFVAVKVNPSGTLQTEAEVVGSVVALQGGTWRTSVISSTPSSMLAGASIFGQLPSGTQVLGSVAVLQGTIPFDIAGSVLAVQGTWSGSVLAVQGTWSGSVLAQQKGYPVGSIMTQIAGQPVGSVYNQPVGYLIGSILVGQNGTRVSSLVSTVPSSVIVGSSIFGQLPGGAAVIGSVATLQGTSPWNIAGSVLTVPSSTTPGSVVAHQGTNPWVVGSVITMAVPGTPFRYNVSIGHTSAIAAQASVAGKSHYITDFMFANTGSVTTLITIKGGDTSVLGYTIAPAGGGSNSPDIKVPMKATAAQDLVIQAASPTSLLYATVNGYTI